MNPKIDKVVIFPISAFVLILFTVFLTIFIDPIESNFAIVLPLGYYVIPMFFAYFIFLGSLILFIYGGSLILKGIRHYIKNSNQIKLRMENSACWYSGGKFQLIALVVFWIGLITHNFLVIILHGYSYLGYFLPNFSYFLITFILIISPVLSFILLLIGDKMQYKSYENEKNIKSDLLYNSEWLKEQYLTKNRSIQDIADELGISMIEIKKEIAKVEQSK